MKCALIPVHGRLKLAGLEATFEQLLAKARLEEAKLRVFFEKMPGPLPPLRKSTPMLVAHSKAGGDEGGDSNRERLSGGPKCYYCRGQEHITKNCPVKGRAVPVESLGWRGGNVGSPRTTTLKSLVAGGDSMSSTWVEELRHTLCEAQLENKIATIYGVVPDRDERDVTILGPTPTVDITIEGVPVRAMIDTGSPITLVSLEFLLETLAKQ